MKNQFLKTSPVQHAVRILVTGLALTMLTACVSFDGIQSNAKINTLNADSGGFSLRNANGMWPDAHWAVGIGGKDLQTLIDQALANNPSLQVAAARLKAAQAATTAVNANSLPSVNASFDSTYQRFTEKGLIPPPLAGTYNSNNQLALNASYEFDFWGKHSAEMRAALSQEKVAEAEGQSVRLLLSNAIARSWLQLARQYAQLDLSTQQLAIREKLDTLTHQRVKAGLETDTAIQQDRIQTVNLKTDIAQWKEAIALTRNQIAALQGFGPKHGKEIAKPELRLTQENTLPASLPLELIGRRPDIVAARWRVEASEGEIDVAKTQFYPNINLVGFAGLSSLGISNLLQSGSSIVGVGPAIRLPIFEGGRLRAQLKGRVAAYDIAVATYNQSLNDALREVADQVQTLNASTEQAKQQQAAEQAARKNLALAQQRQKIGTSSMLPVLAAENILINEQKRSLEIAIRHADSQINLIKALGGGYDSKANLTDALTTPISHNSTKQMKNTVLTKPEAA
ncbi:MAG: efflux transporter outer membrane subunit [Burkholderiales bacterium]|nr:efflux transporter outer membrane subunit [Burkholderiales bacterium]